MSGIYIHIPFCKKKCNYCDFYSTTENVEMENLITAMCQEIILCKNYLNNESVNTIYFGGGTPSLLNENQLKRILTHLYKHININDKVEITLEVNPDDINTEFIKMIKNTGFNRISIGTQSFSDKELLFLNRRHDSMQAIKSIELTFKAGIKNISADLIFGIPGMSLSTWKNNLKTITSLPINHISAYQLSYEEGTILYNQLKQGKIKEVNENSCWEQYKYLSNFLDQNNFAHYEISNFSKNEFFSIHNSNYWKGVKYLGLGPSAHSFDTESRQWNDSHVGRYIAAINRGKIPYEREILSETDKFNEYIITRLRTMWGIKTDELLNLFGEKKLAHCFDKIKKNIDPKLIQLKDNQLTLTTRGMFVSDMIFRELMIVDNA